jgi:hypothetical protein
MGYSRVSSQSLLRALRTWTLKGFADAGSTGLPLLGLLRNRGVGASPGMNGSGRCPIRLVISTVAQHCPSHACSFVRQSNSGHIGM